MLKIEPCIYLCPGWSWWVEHDCNNGSVVCSKVVCHPPVEFKNWEHIKTATARNKHVLLPVNWAVYQVLWRVDPLCRSGVGSQVSKHVCLVRLFCLTHERHRLFGGEHVPSSVSPKDQASEIIITSVQLICHKNHISCFCQKWVCAFY